MSLGGPKTAVALSEARVGDSDNPEPKADGNGTTMMRMTVRGLDLGRMKDAPNRISNEVLVRATWKTVAVKNHG